MTRQVEYKILTEAKPGLDTIVAKSFESATINIGTGLWKGTKEGSAQVILILDDTPQNYGLVRTVAVEIKKINKQEVVLIEHKEVSTEVI